jgi:iron complex outermembrane recepter protein
VVVTALKRETKLQETPLSISAIGAATLNDSGALDISDVVKFVPGLSLMDAGPGQRRITLRGIQSAGEAQVGLYYDETPVTGSPGTTNDAGQRQPDIKLFDVNRVEVLRGPQGTLYGSGSMGGTVKIINNKPTSNFESSVEATGSVTEHGGPGSEVNAMINVPLVANELAARVVAYGRDQDGWVDDPTLHRKNFNTEHTTGARVLLRFTPIVALSVDAAAYYQDTDSQPGFWAPSAGIYQSASQVVLPFKDKLKLYSLSGSWDLGFANLVGITSYFDRTTLVTIETTFLADAFLGISPALNAYIKTIAPSAFYQPQEITNWTNEVRLSSKSTGPVDWTVGLFSEDRKSDISAQVRVASAATGIFLSPPDIPQNRSIKDNLKQLATYSEVSYALNQALVITVGGRYYNYKKQVEGQTFSAIPIFGFVPSAPLSRGSEESGWLSKLNVSYQASSSLLLYGQGAQGFRPGGVNQAIGLPANLIPYKSDSLWNYELGAKFSWLNNRLTFDGAAYLIDWQNMQVAVQAKGTQFIANAGAAQIAGLELEAAANPLSGLSLTATLNGLKAQLTEDQAHNSFSATGRNGNRIPNVPEFTAGLSAEYKWPLVGSLNGLARADANYVGKSFSDFNSTSITYFSQGAYALLNLRVGVGGPRWSTSIFLNNALDRDAHLLSGAAGIFGPRTFYSAQPRTVGLKFNWSL